MTHERYLELSQDFAGHASRKNDVMEVLRDERARAVREVVAAEIPEASTFEILAALPAHDSDRTVCLVRLVSFPSSLVLWLKYDKCNG